MRKTKSPILKAVRDTANGLHKAGVMDQVTLRKFDRLCHRLRLWNRSRSKTSADRTQVIAATTKRRSLAKTAPARSDT
jgi:Holliday junction resolvase-like predicted endonuclease